MRVSTRQVLISEFNKARRIVVSRNFLETYTHIAHDDVGLDWIPVCQYGRRLLAEKNEAGMLMKKGRVHRRVIYP